MKNKIFVFSGVGLDSNIYFLKDQATLIDTGSDSRRLEFKAFLKKHGFKPSDIENIFLTHFHKDHTGKVDMFKEAEVFGGEKREGIKKAPNEIKIGKTEFEILETPGHTEESISIFIPEWNAIFTGDTKFSRLRWGRTDLKGSKPDKIEGSIRKINWKPWYLLLPGHGRPYRRNKFLGIDLGTEETGICFLGEDDVEFNHSGMSVSYLKELVDRFKPNIVAIDAPLSRTGEPYRKVEKEMREEGFEVLPLNTEGMQKLMEKGVRLKDQLGEEKYFIMETHPESSRKALDIDLGGIYKKLDLKRPENEHEEDAFLCSLAAYSFVRGKARVFEVEDRIVIAKGI